MQIEATRAPRSAARVSASSMASGIGQASSPIPGTITVSASSSASRPRGTTMSNPFSVATVAPGPSGAQTVHAYGAGPRPKICAGIARSMATTCLAMRPTT